MAFGLAVYASPPGLPQSTQDSLPAVGQTLLGGLLPAGFQRKVSECFVTSHPPSPSFLAQSHRPTCRTGGGKLFASASCPLPGSTTFSPPLPISQRCL